MDGVGETWVALLKANEEKPNKGAKSKSKWRSEPPALGLFASPAIAALAALLEHEESETAGSSGGGSGGGPHKAVVCSWERLLELTSAKLEAGRSFKPLEAIRAQTGFCEAWEQVVI